MTSKLSPKPRGARKPEAAQRMVNSMRASSNLHLAETYLMLASRHIDTAGDLAGTTEADMLACYASNVLQGSLSLIRELRASLKPARRSLSVCGRGPSLPSRRKSAR